MACFSRESGSWGDSCVALLGTACLLVAILASAFTVAQWQQNRETYKWTHCSVGHITDAIWMECPVNANSTGSGLGAADFSASSWRTNPNSSYFPCVRVMVSYLDAQGHNRLGILLHPNITTILTESDTPKCSLTPCAGSTAQNEATVRAFTERWRHGHGFSHFSCYYNSSHYGQVYIVRPRMSRVLEVVVLFTVVVCVVCALTTLVRCRCVYLNAREARSCLPSANFCIVSSVRSLRALLWTLAYKLFDWKLQSSTSQTLSGNDTQGLVEQYREEREDADPCLPAVPAALPAQAALPARASAAAYSQPRQTNSQMIYTPLACPPSDIRL